MERGVEHHAARRVGPLPSAGPEQSWTPVTTIPSSMLSAQWSGRFEVAQFAHVAQLS